MVKKKQSKSRPRGHTRVELTRELGVGLTTIDRLIAFDLKVIGRRGRAKTYSLAGARLMARRLGPAETAASDVLVKDYATQALDFQDRRNLLLETWVADDAWLPCFRRLVELLRRVTKSWPARIGARLGRATAGEAASLGWADGPRVLSPLPAPVAGEHAMAKAIEGRKRAESVPPFMRLFLEEFAASFRSSPLVGELAGILEPPEPESLPPNPKTVEEARQRWRAARSAYRETRVAIRRGHHRRQKIHEAIQTAIALHTAAWWSVRGQFVVFAGNADAARELATRNRTEALKKLSTLDGLLPVEEPTESRKKKKAPKKATMKKKATVKRATSARKPRKK